MAFFVITGATTGIGAAIARTIPKEGDTVALHYHRNAQACGEIAAELQAEGVDAQLIAADFAANPDAAARAVTEMVRARTERVDVLINNAGGILSREHAEHTDFAAVSSTINLNLITPMMLAGYLTPLLRNAAEAGGRADIVNITSIAARSGAPTVTAYGAAKAGLENFARGLAKELAPLIRVNTVSPGVIETPFHEGKTPRDRMETWLEHTPLGRHGEPEDIAHAVAFVLQNGFMSGAVVPVNGGIQMI